MARGVTLDAGALIAADRNSRAVWTAYKKARVLEVDVTVPSGALAQVWRGSHPRLAQLLAGCVVEPLDERGAKRAGRLLARSHTADVIDASVAIGAIDRGDAIWTSDPEDMRRLAEHLGAKTPLIVTV